MARYPASPVTPGAHNTSHQSGGSDSIKLDDLAAPDDNTDLNASITKHGLVPKLPNDAAKYLDGTGAWSTPGGAPAGGGTIQKLAISNPPAGDSTWPIFVAPSSLTLIRIRSIMIGTGSGAVDATINGTEQLSPDQSLSTSWQDSGAISGSMSTGDELAIALKSIAGTVSYVVVQVELS